MNPRAAALQALCRGGDAQAALDDVLVAATLDARDRAFATELVKGTTKMRRALAWSVERFLHRPLQSLDAPLRWTLLMGAYQLLYLHLPAHAVVDESVHVARQAGHRGTASLANAVLRKLAADGSAPPQPGAEGSVEELAVWASLPDWIARHLVERFGFAKAAAIARGINATPRRALRVDTARWSASEARNALEQHGFTTSASGYGIPECLVLSDARRGDRRWLQSMLSDGALVVQSEESQLAVHLLDPRPGQVILDVCAGRGTKTGQIAARMDGAGTIVSVDDDVKKLQVLEASLARSNAQGVTTVAADARKPLPPEVPMNCDAAIIDAPCSALGILGRRADARWRKTPGDPARFAAVQSAIVRNVSGHVRDGGRILYVTCSTHPAEDEDVIEEFLRAQPVWRASRIDAPASSAPDAHVRLGSNLLIVPGLFGNDGFFYARLERGAANDG